MVLRQILTCSPRFSPIQSRTAMSLSRSLLPVRLEGLVGEENDRVGGVLDDPRWAVRELQPVSDLGVGRGMRKPVYAVLAVAHHGVEADDLFRAQRPELRGSLSSASPKGWSTLLKVWGGQRFMGSESAATDPSCVWMIPS